MKDTDGKGDARLLAMRIVWLALMAGVALYAGVAWVLVAIVHLDLGMSGSPLPRLLPWITGGGVILLGVGLSVARRGEEPADREAPPEAKVDRYFMLRLVGVAIEESVGLLVVTVSLLAGAANWALAGGLAAVAVMAVSGPQEDHLHRLRG